MSPTPLDLPILISQLPYVQKIAHAENAKPEIQRQLFGPLIREQIQKQEGLVQQVEKNANTAQVDRDGHNNEHQPPPFEHKEKEQDAEPSEGGASSASPWAGNIVNVKI
ncbi:hypothetical protein GO013_14365 [Pseudodesulfovibrio sp. JC047]|uniref:hypothetical protein n=1 Tax=Pseudodesulfovibrio sp. JC047 TaxID=2683199 RepID=UPI0013CFD165|nr:hypothetical protein [Pseudodesulfovibrio sp. JC047]NDV20592.1 hypothetical protein [Pseudodesulfovibrio sp. JC047]